jgi:hypothetical protein
MDYFDGESVNIKPEPIQMVARVRRSNMEIRANQIIRLLMQICEERPLKIVPKKINDSVQSYNLAWVIAICQRNWHLFGEVRLEDLGLTPLVNRLNLDLIEALHNMGELHKLKPKWFDEVDLRGSEAVHKILSYELPPELIIKLISNKLIYKTVPQLCITNIKGDKVKSPRKDIVSEAMQRFILPVLLQEKTPIEPTNIHCAKTCWDRLPNALASLGCTNISINEKGKQDCHSFSASHGTLNIPVTTFKAFRRRVPAFVEHFLTSLKL